MKKDKPKLYFVALVPEGAVFDDVLALKHEVRERFGSRAALRSPPHVTLHMPFQWQEEKEGRLIASLNKLAEGIGPFPITLNGFGAFPPRVIYVQVEASEALSALYRAVQQNARQDWHIYPKNDHRPFRPHMTIAFRDLQKPAFVTAWAEFQQRQFNATFTARDLCLLKHNGQSWDIRHRSPLG